MSKNLIALQNRFLGQGETIYDSLALLHDEKAKKNLPVEQKDLLALAKDSRLPAAHVYSVASFYDELSVGPTTSKVKVCNGEACICEGSAALKLKLQKHTQQKISDVVCLGFCDHSPAVLVEYEDKKQVYAIPDSNAQTALCLALEQKKHPNLPLPEHKVYQSDNEKSNVLLRNMQVDVRPIASAKKRGAYASLQSALKHPPENLLETFKASQLRGRGGAGFPIAIKLQTVFETQAKTGKRAVVVCNADEGDAGAYIDKVLLEKDPHAVLEGILLAAYACNADTAFIYLRGEYPAAIELWKKVLHDAASDHLLGKNILGSSFSCTLKLVPGHGAYVCGEETSLLRSLEGVAGQVSPKPPFPAVEGYQGRPTAVNNVETLANLPWIVEHGGDAFSALGFQKSRGTKLISLNSAVQKPGVYEVEFGSTLRTLLEKAGGLKDGKTFQAAQVGGPLGGILDDKALDLPFDFESYASAGVMLGHAGVVFYTTDVDLVFIGRGLMRFCAIESCGKCFPCRLGSIRGVDLFDKILGKKGTQADLELLAELCETMQFGSLCALGGGIPTPIHNLLTTFISAFEPYISDAKVPKLLEIRLKDKTSATPDEVRND